MYAADRFAGEMAEQKPFTINWDYKAIIYFIWDRIVSLKTF